MSQIHRDHPELTEEEASLLALVGPRAALDDGADRTERECQCGAPFTIKTEDADRTTKWYRLCPSCLYDEL